MRRSVSCVLFTLLIGGWAIGQQKPLTALPKVSAIYINGNIQTMDGTDSVAQAVAINNGLFRDVGSTAYILSKYQSEHVTDLKGATVLPGFIDTHSHMQGWGGIADPANWLDLGTTNAFLKPLPTDPRCQTPADPQYCFIPVTTQDDVISRLQSAVAKSKSNDSWILASMYDPSRLGHSLGCGPDPTKVGFDCRNFEGGHARLDLDSISTKHPILVGSQSGHIVYANTAMLKLLKICGTDVVSPKDQTCQDPALDPVMQAKLANLGILVEDLSGYAQGKAIAHIVSVDSKFPTRTFNAAVNVYANHGYTFVQEGAASDTQALFYSLATLKSDFPFTAALLYTSGQDIKSEVAAATGWRAVNLLNSKVIIHGIKDFADGSNQGFTGHLLQNYFTLYYPFTDSSIFAPPYLGIADIPPGQVTADANYAHKFLLPLGIHQNGDGAITQTLQDLQAVSTPNLYGRDIMIHFSLASPADLATAKSLDTGVTFLITNLYYYGLQFCQQVLGPARAATVYPTGSALTAGLRFSLHPDSPVGPPYPLFMIWIAKTRNTQQPPWYPNVNPSTCPVVMGPNEVISIRQGIKAFTTDAAYVYGLESLYGSIEPKKFADMVVLSDDPMAMESNPDQLRMIRVLGTVRHGEYRANPEAHQTPIWPD